MLTSVVWTDGVVQTHKNHASRTILKYNPLGALPGILCASRDDDALRSMLIDSSPRDTAASVDRPSLLFV